VTGAKIRSSKTKRNEMEACFRGPFMYAMRPDTDALLILTKNASYWSHNDTTQQTESSKNQDLFLANFC